LAEKKGISLVGTLELVIVSVIAGNSMFAAKAVQPAGILTEPDPVNVTE